MPDDIVQVDPRSRLLRRLDQLCWQLAKIEGECSELRRSLNAFRADVANAPIVTLTRCNPSINDNGGPTDVA